MSVLCTVPDQPIPPKRSPLRMMFLVLDHVVCGLRTNHDDAVATNAQEQQKRHTHIAPSMVDGWNVPQQSMDDSEDGRSSASLRQEIVSITLPP